MPINANRLPVPAILFALAALVALSTSLGGANAAQDDGFEQILRQRGNGTYHKGGWNHYGPGYFELDRDSGEIKANGGMGLFWFAERTYSDFELKLEFKTSGRNANSGVFVRVPEMPASDDYIYHSFEVQIHDSSSEGIHQTGAVYDAEPSSRVASHEPGEWNEMRIRFVGDQITVWVNGEQVVDWMAEPRGKIEDFAGEGYIGLQNHDDETSVWFRNIRIKDLAAN